MAAKYFIPSLLQPVKPYIKPNNPLHDELEAEYIAWIDEASFLTDSHKKAWKRAQLPLLMTRVYPEASKAHLRVALEYMMLFLILEQLTDTPASTHEAQRWADTFVRALEQTLSDSEASGPVAVMKHLASRILASIDPPYQSYFIASNTLLAEGVVKEAADRENPDPSITLEKYMDARRSSIGFRPFLDIMRWIWKLDISGDVLSHPLVARMEDDTVDLVALANDLYSYKKEFYESGAGHNYVTVAMHDPVSSVRKGDRQGAIDYTYKRYVEILAEFNHARESLPSFGEEEDRKLRQYIAVMMDGVVGNTQWSLACERYGHSPDEQGGVVFEMEPL